MNIVMVDKSAFIDRRIVLEANSLQEEGHKPTLLNVRGATDAETESVNGLPVVRFSFAVNTAALDILEVDSKVEEARVNRSLERMTWLQKILDAVIPSWTGFVGRKFKTTLLLVSCPRAGLATMHNCKRGLAFKGLLVILLSLLTLNPRIFWSALRICFRKGVSSAGKLASKLPLLKPRRKPPEIPMKAPAAFTETLQDSWDHQVFDYVKSLAKVDIIHTHDLTSLPAAVACARHRRVPLVYDSHELYSYQPGFTPERVSELFNMEVDLIQYVDHVIVINEQMIDVMRRDLGDRSFTALTNATNLPTGFDIRKRYNLIREKTGIPQDEPILLFQGIINRLRFIDLLLEGLAQAQRTDVHMVFLTWGIEIYEFREMARTLGIGHRVHFLPPVDWDQIVYWAASADAGIMPYQPNCLSVRISSPNKMYEFIAAGTPMIGSSELENVHRIVSGEGFGVTLPLIEPKDYAAAIDKMFDVSKGGASRFRPNLLAKSRDYLWECEAEKLVALYRRIEGEQSGKASAARYATVS